MGGENIETEGITRHPFSGIYYVKIQQDGVRKNFPLGKSRKEALELLDDLEKKLSKGEIALSQVETSQVVSPNGGKDLRVEELAHIHLEWVRENRSDSTYQVRKHYVNLFLEFVGAKMISEISRLTIDSFKIWASKQNKRGCGHEPLRHIKTFLRWGEENELCTLPFRRFPTSPNIPRPTRVLSAEEIQKILAVVPDDVSRQIRFLLLTGLRPQEFKNLRWADIIKEQNGVVRLKVDHPKAEKLMRSHQNRSAVLSKEAQAIIEEERSLHPKTTHVFVNDDGTPYAKRILTSRFSRWGAKAGITNFKPYDLRHWFGTAQAASSTNQSIIRQLMGHTKITTTDRYIHPVDTAHQEAMSKIASLVSNFGKN